MLTATSLCMAELHIIQEKEKFGYADETGNVVIKPQYTKATFFENGMAKVCKGDKWGYIDETGKPVIAIEYDEIDEFNDNGIALVKKGKKKGYIRKDGSIMIKPEFNFIGAINEKGYVWVAKGKTLENSMKGLFLNDKMILPVKYREFGFYQKTDSIDYGDGNIFVSAQATEMTKNMSRLSLSDIPYIWTDVMFKRGIVDLEGNVVVKNVAYAMGAPVQDRVAMCQFAKKKNKYNYMTFNGKGGQKLFKNDIEKAITEEDPNHAVNPFFDGVAKICLSNRQAYLIDLDGYKISDDYTEIHTLTGKGFIAVNNGSYNLLDSKGKNVGASDYSRIVAPFDNNFSALAACNKEGKYGFIDLSGKEICPFVYDDATTFCYGNGYVKSKGKWGVIDNKMNFKAQPRWADIMVATNDNIQYVWVKNQQDSKWNCLKLGDDCLVSGMNFVEVSPFSAEGNSIVKTDENFAVVNTGGAMVIPARFSSPEVCAMALEYLKSSGKASMSEADAYRFNIYNHPDRHKFKLNQNIDSNMWDF